MTDQPKPTPVARPQCTELTSEQLLAQNDELTADLRTASDQCEALFKNLADHKHQLDTMVEENRRLREMLRRVAVAAERDDFGSVGVELLQEIKHAGIGAQH